MAHKDDYSVAAAIKREIQRDYARNRFKLDADRVRGCRYGPMRRSKNPLVKMIPR